MREIADKYGVGMEAELGQIMGVEDDMVVDESDSVLTDPEDAQRFCDALDLSAFACAVGTAHGFYKGEPVVDFDRIEAINRLTRTPRALHGGTGLSDDTVAFIDSVDAYRAAKPKDYEPLRVIDAQYQACKTLFHGFIEKFGGTGQGAKFLESQAGK